MAKTETVHDVVFEIYSLKTASTPKKEKVRKFIKRQLNKIYPDKTWNDLSKIGKILSFSLISDKKC